MTNNEVPISGVLKYIKQDRDRYRQKLETLVPYTKNLEEKVKELMVRNLTLENAMKDYAEMKKTARRVGVLEGEKLKLIAENSALVSDYKKSEWYAQLKASRKALRRENILLKQALNKYLVSKYPIEEENDD